MAFTVEIDPRTGVLRVTCATAKEVRELVREFGGNNPVISAPLRAAAGSNASPTRNPRTRKILKLMKVVRDGGEGGVEAGELAKTMGFASGKALAGMVTSVNATMKDHGLVFTDVIDLARNSNGVRRWSPGPQLTKAIALLETTRA